MKTRILARRGLCGLAVGAAFVAGVLLGQTPSVFEVASIRPAAEPTPQTIQSGQFHIGTKIDGTHLDFGFVSLWDLLPYSYRVKPYAIVRPEWTRDSRWNILANLPANTGKAEVPGMMKALLTDRFKLSSHQEKREQPVYELAVAPGGIKIDTGDPKAAQIWDGSFPGFGFGGLLRGDTTISGRIVPQANCDIRWEFVPLPMSAFVDALSMFLNKPVVDATGLKGDYKVVLDINAETMQAMNRNMADYNGLPAPGGGGGGGKRGPDGGAGPPPPPPPPSMPPDGRNLMQCLQSVGDSDGSTSRLFKAVEKLGLDLKQGRAPVDTVIVDHLEKSPTEN